MDKKVVPIQITLRTSDAQRTTGEISIKPLSQLDRIKYAGKYFGICFVFATGFLAIPVLHFFLPPIMLIVGVYLFFRKLQPGLVMGGGLIHCPACQKEFNLENRCFVWPRAEQCPHCRSQLIMTT
jgi:hypothetical protein